jgi:serine/threonine protein kinase
LVSNQIIPSTAFNFTLETQHVQTSSKLNNYKKIKQIGVESSGNIYLSIRKHDVLLVCLKFINLLRVGISDQSDLDIEINLLKKLIHLNIVKYFEHFAHKNKIVFLMEYIKGQSLREIINKQLLKNESFPEDFILQVFSHMVSAISFCHSKQIIQKDIKPENILITKITNSN